MHFYLKLDSKASWDDQASPGGDPGGSDSPKREDDATDTAVWTGLTVNTAYDVRVRVAAYSDVLDEHGNPTGWVYSDWVERQVTTGAGAAVPVPTGIQVTDGSTTISFEATRAQSLAQHRAFRMHFYLKLGSKSGWDDQANPGGDPGGSDSPRREDDATDTAVWAGLTENTTYDVRVRVAAFSDVLDSSGDETGWVYSDWVERQVTTRDEGMLLDVPQPTDLKLLFGPSAVSLRATRADSLIDHRELRMHFYLKLASKTTWDEQVSPGGSATGTDNPLTETSATDRAVWTGLTVDTVYDVRVRVAAYSDVLDSFGDPTGWVYSDWLERQVTTGAGSAVPAPTGVQEGTGIYSVNLRATRTNNLPQHRAFRMHFYLKPTSKEAWDEQASPGGDPGGGDSPMKENGVTDTAVWTGLTAGTSYDIRMRVAAYSDVLDSAGNPTGWVYSDWVERQATADDRPPPPPPIPAPTGIELEVRSATIEMTATRIQSLRTYRAFRMHFYLKPVSKSQWDYQSAPGGDPGGTDSPIRETAPRDTAFWSGLTAYTSYHVRVRVAAYSDAPHEDGGVYGWQYSPWVQREVTTSTGLRLPTMPLLVMEGESGSYEIALLTAPEADVTVTVTSDNPDVTVSSDTSQSGDANSLSFTPQNWDAVQTMTVVAAEDADLFAETVTLTHAAVSTDTKFDMSDAGIVTVMVADNDACPNTMDEKLLSDCNALLDARDDLRGTAALNWSPATDVGDWEGVTVGVNNRVTKLDLNRMGLNGSIPAALGNLSVLEALRLHENELSGTIPPELARLAQLTTLWLSGNQLAGSVPSELGALSDLKDLQIYNNELSGIIPLELGSLASLTTLRLSGNQLTGEIPSALGDLANLEILRLHGNRLTGPIPSALANLKNLERLYLNDNELDGTISPDLGVLTHLERLYLYDNNLTGAIPTDLANLGMLPKGGLRLYGNRLTGCVPAALASHESHITAQQNDVNLPLCAPELELSVGETGISLATGTSVTYRVRLKDVRPTAPVTVAVASDNDHVTVDTDTVQPDDQNTLTFTFDNWTNEQAVTVHARSDAVGQTATLSHSVTSADNHYANSEPVSVVVTVTGDEARVVALTPTSSFTVVENTTAVGAVATFPESADGILSYVLVGADAPLFSISQPDEMSSGGELSFREAPDYEEPKSAAGDNAYILTVEVHGSAGTEQTLVATRSVSVTVIDVAESLGPQPTTRLPDLTLDLGSEAEQLDVGSAFSHPNEDVLRFDSRLDQEGIVDVTGDTLLTISPRARGTARLTITATDLSGLSASQTVSLTVTNTGLRKSAERSLEGFGRSVIASVSSQVRARLDRREKGQRVSLESASRRSSRSGVSRLITITDTAPDHELSPAADGNGGICAPGGQERNDIEQASASDQQCAGCGLSSGSVDNPIGYYAPEDLQADVEPPDAGRSLSGIFRLDVRSTCSNSVELPAAGRPDSRIGSQFPNEGVDQLQSLSSSTFLQPAVGAPNPRHASNGSTISGLDRALSLLPSNFDLQLNGREGEGDGTWTVWGARDRQAWNGDGHDGGVTSLYLGLDYQVQPNWIMGLSVTRNGADSRYRHGWASQEMDMGLTTVLPYLSYRTPNDRTSIWGVAGAGSGTLYSTVVGTDGSSSALDMKLYMVGGRHWMARLGDLNITFTGDLAVVDLETPKGEGAVQALEASVSRVRAGLDFKWTWQPAPAVSVTPSGELSVRRDDADEGAGTGLEFSGGVVVTKDNFRLEAKGRTLLVHTENDYSESGYALLASFAPGENGKGLTMSLGSQWGTQATDTGMMWADRLLNAPGAAANDDDRPVTWTGNVGYGFYGWNERYLLTPFVNTDMAESQVQGIRLGAQIRRLARDRVFFDMDLALGGRAREHVGIDGELSVKIQARF